MNATFFYSLCTDPPCPVLRGGGVLTQATILLVKRIKMTGMLLNFSKRRMSPKKVTKKNIYTGVIKTFIGLRSYSSFINFASVYVSNLTEYIKETMGTRPSLFDSC